jgi:hypothetical protein
MANTGSWVGLDTNATAGRNEAMTGESGDADIEFLVTHNSMADIVATSNAEANVEMSFVLLYFVLCRLAIHVDARAHELKQVL